MSGHSKWSTIKHKKGAIDAKRGAIFSRFGKEITMAVRAGGSDPEMNPRLRTALNAAKGANVPRENISRAIKRGSGELGGGVLEELGYEGFAPGGVAILVNCLSDNRNRTAANIRAYFTKNNANLGGTGSVSRLFNRKAKFLVEGEGANEEHMLELLLEAEIDVEDIYETEDGCEIITAPDAFGSTAKALEAAEITIAESSMTMIADLTVDVAEVSIARQVLRLIDMIEEDEDVQEVFSNADISDSILAEPCKIWIAKLSRPGPRRAFSWNAPESGRSRKSASLSTAG
jgi:YebC/PmpR family DNA-binding regulatory protein